MRLSGIGQALIPALNRIRAQLNRDAIRHGRLRLWHRDQRTPRGEQTIKKYRLKQLDNVIYGGCHPRG